MVDRLHAEVLLLRSLHHDHIIGFHKVWLATTASATSSPRPATRGASATTGTGTSTSPSRRSRSGHARFSTGSTTSTPRTPASSTATSTAATSLSTATPVRICPPLLTRERDTKEQPTRVESKLLRFRKSPCRLKISLYNAQPFDVLEARIEDSTLPSDIVGLVI